MFEAFKSQIVNFSIIIYQSFSWITLKTQKKNQTTDTNMKTYLNNDILFHQVSLK